MSSNQEISAEELAKGQESISISEFFEKNRQMLGFDSQARAIVTAVKEGVDNSLDATEEAGRLPDIRVDITEEEDYYVLTIEDNGPGIVEENIAKVFGKLLYGSRFQARVQSRGQQGIGISAAVLYSQITTGEPTLIKSKTTSQDKARFFKVVIDTETNEPDIKEKKKVEWDKDQGTVIEMKMKANMRSRSRLIEYIKNTAIVNPHANLVLDEPQGKMEFERVSTELPEKPEEIRPHPHGVDLGDMMRMMESTSCYSLSGFLQEEFTKVGQKTAQNIIDNFRDQFYGREMSWNLSRLDSDYMSKRVHDAIRKKDKEVDYFLGAVESILNEKDSVSHSDVVEAVETASDDVEEEFDTRFGDTVREKAVGAVWDSIDEVKYGDLRDVVDEATSKRKKGEVIDYLSYSILEKFAVHNGRERITKSELKYFVSKSSREVEAEASVSIGDTSTENMLNALWDRMKTVPDDVPKIKELKDDRNMCRKLKDAMSDTKVNRPSSKCLSPIGAELVEKGLRKEYDADFYTSTTRDAGVYKGAPFVVEAGIAYGGELEKDKADLLRFANRVPLVYQEGACVITDVVKSIGWRNYGLNQSDNSLPSDELVLMVHVASTNVPFTSESKDAIANTPELETEIERAVREVSRELKDYIKKKESLSKKREKRNVVTKLMPRFSEKLAEITGGSPPDYEESLSKIVKSVLVEKQKDGVKLKNNLNNGQEFEIKIETEDNSISDNSGVEESEEGYYIWSGKIKNGEEVFIEYNTEESEEFEIRDLESEKYDLVGKF